MNNLQTHYGDISGLQSSDDSKTHQEFLLNEQIKRSDSNN